jgi:hypothetical protein
MGKIKAIVKRADEPVGHMTNISCSLENLQKHVGGYIETVTIARDLVIICNEEGRLLGLPHNCRIAGVDFVGDIVILGVDGEDFADVPITFEEYKNTLLGVE